ncbi:hypothetical protein ONZ45_g5871 [Pleurotus djamor]|nr:hypothetical protein ONZ45_g5871 [Pleurotus djamor]
MQSFRMINITKREKGAFFDILGCFRRDRTTSALITVPQIGSYKEAVEGCSMFRRSPSSAHLDDLGLLTRVPTEVILLIFEEVASLETAIMFAIANSRLLELAYDHICERLVQNSSPWVCDRLICLGDRVTDLPESCLAEQEGSEILAYFRCKSWECDAHCTHTTASYGLACACFPMVEGQRKSPGEDWWSGVDSPNDFHRYFYMQTLWQSCNEPLDPRILVNISKKEYFRDTENLDLDAVLPALTLWASKEECGPWAGDQLAIVSMHSLAEQIKKESGWKDITETGEVLKARFPGVFSYYDPDDNILASWC